MPILRGDAMISSLLRVTVSLFGGMSNGQWSLTIRHPTHPVLLHIVAPNPVFSRHIFIVHNSFFRWEDNIKMDLREVGRGHGLDRSGSG